MAILRLWPFFGYGLAALLLGLYLHARDDLAASIGDCNADTLEAALHREQGLRAAESRRHAGEIAEYTRLLQARARAIDEATDIAAAAVAEARETQDRNRQLIEDAANANTPPIINASRCYSVVVPAEPINRLCEQAAGAGADGGGDRTRTGAGACIEGAHGAD